MRRGRIRTFAQARASEKVDGILLGSAKILRQSRVWSCPLGRLVRENDIDPSAVDGIDETDVKILKILQAEGRIALSEIARRLDLGTATIHERTDALEEAGFIREYRADLDESMLGFEEVAFINVKTDAGRFAGVAERLAEHAAIQAIHEVTGDADLLLKVRVSDRDALTAVIADIGESEGVVGTETNIALGTAKESGKLDL